MSRRGTDPAPGNAARELLLEQFNSQAEELPWLTDPDLIPESSMSHLIQPTTVVQACRNVSRWMTEEMTTWTSNGHRRLRLREVFEKYDLSTSDRVSVRQRLLTNGEVIYEAGNNVMGEIHAVVPAVASREGAPAEEWGQIASKARKFGIKLARDGTEIQGLTRGIIGSNDEHGISYLDPSQIQLDDETGITTVTPIDEIIDSVKRMANERYGEEAYKGVCLALLSRPRGLDKTMWDATWDAFNSATTRLIYPKLTIDDSEIQPIQEPIVDIDAAANEAADRFDMAMEESRIRSMIRELNLGNLFS